MHIGVLFYSDTVALTESTRSILGRAVANNGFLQALLSAGGDQRVSVIVSSSAEAEWVTHSFPAINDQRHTLVCLQALNSFVQKNPFDVLHILGPDLYRGFSLRQRLNLGPVAITGITHTLSHAPFLDWLVLNLMHQPRSSDALICTTPTAQTAVQEMIATVSPSLRTPTPLRTEILPLGITTAALNAPQTDPRAQLGIPADTVIILSLGRFSPYSKTDLMPLLIAYRELLKRPAPPTRLILAGATGDDTTAELLALIAQDFGIADHVVFVTNPDDALKAALLQTADLFAAFSDNPQETFGLSVIEALASGLPIVCSDWDGYRALVEDGVTGFRIPTLSLAENHIVDRTAPAQVDALNHLFFAQAVATDVPRTAQILERLIGDQNLRERMGNAARAAGTAYDWQELMPRYFALWQKLSVQAKSNPLTLPTHDPALAYAPAFRGFASANVADSDRFTITPLGKDAATGRFVLRRYAAMDEVLDNVILSRLLRATQNPVTLAEIKKTLDTQHAAESVAYHVLYLHKYGLLAWERA